MLAQERKNRILDIVESSGSATIRKIRSKISVSDMTIWRDLDSLEKQGLVKRVRGGAVGTRLDVSGERRFKEKQQDFGSLKNALSIYAAREFVADGDVICLDGGTTVSSIVSHLNHENLTVLTNSMEVAKEVSERSLSITLISSGGVLRNPSETFVGPDAESFFAGRGSHKLILSATGLSLDHGLTDPNPLDTQVKKAMISSAEKVIALIDSSKFGLRSLMTFASLEQIDILVTDSNACPETVAILRESGVDVRIVEVAGEGESA